MTDICVDSSCLVEIGRGLPRTPDVLEALSMASECLVSTATLLETSMVIGGGEKFPEQLVARFGLTPVSVDDRILREAWRAWRIYGRGRHPARLNFGDCFSYATANAHGVPLLYIGDDFAKTDVTAALST